MREQNQNSRTRRMATAVLAMAAIAAAVIYSCTKHDNNAATSTSPEGDARLKTNSAQPLPGGKANFSVAYGNLDNTGSTWVGLCNLTFNAAAGTVAKTLWSWDSGSEKGKAVLNLHTCTLNGHTQNCNTYTPYGWITPAALWKAWSGTYTYNTSTNVLSISWTTVDGAASTLTESWDVTNPQTNIAKLAFKTSNYSITHGRGYGSNAGWSTYKTIGQIPLNTNFPGYRVTVSKSAGGVYTVVPTTAGAWYPDALNTTGYTYSANGLAMHHYDSTSSACGSGGASTIPGIVYHLASTNNSRHVVYGHFCASLTSDANFPCYSGQMHPYAFDEVINDDGVLKGFIGIEQQDESGYSDYQYQLKDYFINTP